MATKQLDIFGDGQNIVEVEVTSDGKIVLNSLPKVVDRACGCRFILMSLVNDKYPSYSQESVCSSCSDANLVAITAKKTSRKAELENQIVSLSIRKKEANTLGFVSLEASLDDEITTLQQELDILNYDLGG